MWINNTAVATSKPQEQLDINNIDVSLRDKGTYVIYYTVIQKFENYTFNIAGQVESED